MMAQSREDFADNVVDIMKRHFGDQAKAFWVYVDDRCPGCRVRPIDEMIYQGERAVSLNAFLYREHSVLIAYFLCDQCANLVMAIGQSGATTSPLHQAIEANLKAAYHRYLKSLHAN
jgi:hypothetical protein